MPFSLALAHDCSWNSACVMSIQLPGIANNALTGCDTGIPCMKLVRNYRNLVACPGEIQQWRGIHHWHAICWYAVVMRSRIAFAAYAQNQEGLC